MINIQNEFQSIIDSGYPYEAISNWDEVSFSIPTPHGSYNQLDSNKLFEISDNYKLFSEVFEDFKNICTSLLEKYPNMLIYKLDNQFKVHYRNPNKPKSEPKKDKDDLVRLSQLMKYKHDYKQVNSEIERFKQNYFAKFKKL